MIRPSSGFTKNTIAAILNFERPSNCPKNTDNRASRSHAQPASPKRFLEGVREAKHASPVMCETALANLGSLLPCSGIVSMLSLHTWLVWSSSCAFQQTDARSI